MKTGRKPAKLNKLYLLIFSLLAVFIFFFGCQTQESIKKSRISQLEKGLYRAVYFKGQKPEKLKLLNRLQFFKVPGISLAVVDKDKIEWFSTYGYKDIIKYEKITPATVFQAGELSQPVAAGAILAEVKKGRLKLEEEAGSYYGDLALAGRKFSPQDKISFTISQLLSHSAGFYPWTSTGYPAGERIPDLVQILKGEEPATNFFSWRGFDQEAGVRYSDFNYVLLQKFLEDKTGKKLPELAREEIFTPLNITRAFWDSAELTDLATGHSREGSAIEGACFRYPEQAARGLWSNPLDYLKFVLEIVNCARGKNDGLLSPELARQMLSVDPGQPGLGFRLEGQGEKFKIYMTGRTHGFRSALVMYPALGQGALIMTNSDNGGLLVDEILRGLSAIYNWPDFKPEEKPLYRLDPSIYQRYVGRYEVNGSYYLDISFEDYYLVVHPTGQAPTKFYVEAQTIFFSADPFIRIKFNLDEYGQVSGLALWQEDYEIRASKIS
ncbi:MAG: serine hydrolase [Acidobacteriota bacterium]|nr:serine hydrolase [Acidobacteriota bacterium]